MRSDELVRLMNEYVGMELILLSLHDGVCPWKLSLLLLNYLLHFLNFIPSASSLYLVPNFSIMGDYVDTARLDWTLGFGVPLL